MCVYVYVRTVCMYALCGWVCVVVKLIRQEVLFAYPYFYMVEYTHMICIAVSTLRKCMYMTAIFLLSQACFVRRCFGPWVCLRTFGKESSIPIHAISYLFAVLSESLSRWGKFVKYMYHAVLYVCWWNTLMYTCAAHYCTGLSRGVCLWSGRRWLSTRLKISGTYSDTRRTWPSSGRHPSPDSDYV